MFTPTAIERLYFEHEDETWGDSPESKAAFDRCGAEFRKAITIQRGECAELNNLILGFSL